MRQDRETGEIRVAVGTPLAQRPPHRSVRERLTHTALASDDGEHTNLAAVWCRSRLACRNTVTLPLRTEGAQPSRVLLGPSPSLQALRRRFLALVRTLRRYSGLVRLLRHVRLSDSDRSRNSAVRPQPSPTGLLVPAERRGGLPVLAQGVFWRAQVPTTAPGSSADRASAANVGPCSVAPATPDPGRRQQSNGSTDQPINNQRIGRSGRINNHEIDASKYKPAIT
jgi:hypothetical protein